MTPESITTKNPEEKAIEAFQQNQDRIKTTERNMMMSWMKDYFPDAIHVENRIFSYGDLHLSWWWGYVEVVGYGHHCYSLADLGQFLTYEKPRRDYWKNLTWFGKIKHVVKNLF
jgi:hypothetical protein